jgi:hypothetical protein
MALHCRHLDAVFFSRLNITSEPNLCRFCHGNLLVRPQNHAIIAQPQLGRLQWGVKCLASSRVSAAVKRKHEREGSNAH